MTCLAIINGHTRDNHIYMDEPTHTYYLDGKPISISGTGFLHLYFEPFDGPNMAEKTARSAKPGTKYFGKTSQEILNMWENNTNQGTVMHKNIEDFWNGLIPISEIGDRNRFGLFQMCYGWLKQIGLEPYRTEWIIYDKDYDLAGSIDFVARNKKTGNFWIIDWKRSTALRRDSFRGKCGMGPCADIPDCNGFHYQIQVNLYRHILEKHYGIQVEQCCVINLNPELKTYDLLMADDLQDKVVEMIGDWLQNKEAYLKSRHH